MTDPARSPDVPAATRRVLIVASELPPGPGGIGSHAVALATGLHELGWDTTLLGSQHYVDQTERDRYNRDCPVPILTLPDSSDPARTAWARSRAIRATVERTRPDVIVASGGRILWLTAPIARRAGVPMVAVSHGSELGGPGWQRLLTRRSFNSAGHVIAVSEFTAGLTRSLGVTRPIDVIPNGAEAERFAPSPERRQRFRSRHALGDRPVVLTVGNVTERKGQHLVVDALPHLVAELPDVIYVVVGMPTTADALKARAAELGVQDHLMVMGALDADEVVDAHAAADVFAMTSTSTGSGDVEGYGIAVVEAALSGVPAVVTAGTGAAEAVRDGMTGLAVAGEPSAIAHAIATLVTDASEGGSFGAKAEQVARTEGSWSHRVTRYSEVLDTVTSDHRPRIVVVSHTEHWRTDDGTIVGFGATTRELDHLASLFSELVHVAPLYDGPPPGMALPATAPNIRFVPVPPAGGDGIVAKLGAALAVPRWVSVINREMRSADVAHVRCPAGISMVALVVLLLRRQPRHRWVKYAGNWMPPETDALSYRTQRWWLRRGLARASVTVNGRWPDQPSWVHAFNNPTLTNTEIERGRASAAAKQPGEPWRVVFSGRLEQPKGADVAVTTVQELRRRGHDVELDLIGDGPLRDWVESQIGGRDGGSWLRLHGWLTRQELEAILADGHVFLLPTSASEGFPKVIAEAMAFGCVTVTSPVSSIGQVLGETGGAVVVPTDASWADAVEGILNGSWELLMADGLEAIDRFSYSAYLDRLQELAQRDWAQRL